MREIEYIVKHSIRPYVNCIMAGESSTDHDQFNLPLYADGYPGIMFQVSQNGFYLQPKNKLLSELFLYGQTLDPISLETQGPYRFVVFQLYPFASKHLLGVDPRKLNDECFDLLQITDVEVAVFHQRLLNATSLDQEIEIVSDLVEALIGHTEIPTNDPIQKAIQRIIETEGQARIKDIREEVYVTERTLERNFRQQVGLTPKQFAKIIQFQTSLNRLSKVHAESLTQVGIDSGFTDQSHFIRIFKQYTGQTPSYYLRNVKTRT